MTEQIQECIIMTDQMPASDIAKIFGTKHFINFTKGFKRQMKAYQFTMTR